MYVTTIDGLHLKCTAMFLSKSVVFFSEHEVFILITVFLWGKLILSKRPDISVVYDAGMLYCPYDYM